MMVLDMETTGRPSSCFGINDAAFQNVTINKAQDREESYQIIGSPQKRVESKRINWGLAGIR